MQAFWTALRSGAPQAGEFARRGKQGQTLYLRGWYQPLVGEDGRPRAVLKLVIDVSEQVRLVQELRQLSESLQAALAARSAFFANISHEIRTPMNAVVGFAELLRDSLADPRQRQQAQSILDAARALLRILNDLLDVAKLESGEFAILEAPFRLDRLLRDLVSQFGVLASRKAVDLRLDLPAELPPCWRGDGDRVRQILSNLLGNAVKFTERGHITLGARAQEGGVCLWVADTGIGIVPERQQAIFDPFVQADAGTARRYGGTGLGMSIVKRLAERMGGRVTLESALGKGTTVTLWLPLPVDPTGCPDVADDEAPSAADARPLRLLACDDVAQNREVLQLLLQRAGHAIEVFADGQSLLQRYQHDPQAWDAALLDLHMPGWDGLQTCRALRAWEAEQGLPRLPVLALTASVMESDRVAAAAAGMDGFLEKPVTLRALSEALADLRAQRPATAPLPAAAGARPDGEVLAPSRGQALWGDEWIPRLRQWVDEQGGARALGGADSWSEADWHRLAGVAANLAAPAFAQAARACEQALRSKQTPPVGAAQQAWQALCAAVQALPKPARSPDAAAPAASASAPVAAATVEDAVPLWQALLAASERGEVDEPALQRLAQLDPAGAQQLQQWLDEFDFAAAQRWLRERLDHAVKGAPDER
jgi:signal transduction histidine kinase/CheY-like chemotaxis protein